VLVLVLRFVLTAAMEVYILNVSRVLVKCGMRKVKCGVDRAENCCGMVCKLWNAESLQAYSVTAEGSPFAPKCLMGYRELLFFVKIYEK